MKKVPDYTRHSASFRDNDGFIFYARGKLLRQVNRSYQEDFDLLLASKLYRNLTAEGLLIPHKEVGLDLALTKEAYKVVEPQKIDFISYPYEWCFSQLKEAALLTLKIQEKALEADMSLKDASSFNVQFVDGKPIFIDSLSFEKFKLQPWVAYRQFCQHFLNPLLLMSKIDPSLNKLLATYLDGIPAELTSKMLPFWSSLHPAVLVHVGLHARMKNTGKNLSSGAKSFNKKSMLGLLDSLKGTVAGLKLKKMESFWSTYNPQDDSYNKQSFKKKQGIVTELFKMTKAKKVWDLGSNTGLFSRAVADLGGNVISFDYDPWSVEKNYLLSKGNPNILPLVVDWTNPTPPLGWAGEERQSLIDRGPADCILALALIHHLVIGANIPLEEVAGLFAKLCRSLIIEFVPKQDPQVKEMLSLREDIFGDYEPESFEKIFNGYFKITKKVPIKGSLRTLYLMKAK